MIAVGLSILTISPTSAADEQCRSIKSDMTRLACFDRAASSAQSSNKEAHPATDQKVGGAFVDPAEWLRAENDKVAARLKGICRGCWTGGAGSFERPACFRQGEPRMATSRKTPSQVSADNCPRARLHPEVCTQEFRMKNDPYPLHITSAFVSLAIVVLVWALVA
jgi:hypothetical protein